MPELNFPYSSYELTQEVNRIPNQYGLLNALDLFPSEGIGSHTVRIDFIDNQIRVLPAKPRGAPGEPQSQETNTAVLMEIPHFPSTDEIRVGDLSSVMEIVNGMAQPKNLNSETAKILAKIRKNHAITREYLRLGALKGAIKDGYGRTLYDLFTVFNISKKTIDFDLGTGGTDVMAKAEEVNDHILENVKGETVSSVEALVSTTWMNKLVVHPNFEKYAVHNQNSWDLTRLERDRLGGNWGRVVELGLLTLREYKGSIPVADSGGNPVTEKNITANFGHAYPAGTNSMFATFDAPANHVDRVNAVPPEGEEVFISEKDLDHGEGFEFKGQSNALAVCKQPEALVEITTST